jgi:hypothetical protein
MRRGAFFFSVTLCASVFLTGCWKGISHEVVATVLSMRGQVTYVPKGTNDPHILDPGARLNAGCSVRVSDGAEVDITLLPGLLLRVAGDSDFTIDELTLTKDGNETQGGMVNRVARTRFNRGGATISFQLPDQEVGQLIVATSHVTINSSVDSLLRIDTDANSTRAICVRGRIRTTNTNGRTSVLEQGFFQMWGAAATEARPAQTDGPVRAESDKAGKTEAALLEIDPPETFHVR